MAETIPERVEKRKTPTMVVKTQTHVNFEELKKSIINLKGISEMQEEHKVRASKTGNYQFVFTLHQ